MPQGFPNRRSTRIRGYDYSQPGYYHVVICTYQSKWLFGNIVENETRLNKVGQICPRNVAHTSSPLRLR
jgi:putative transposase